METWFGSNKSISKKKKKKKNPERKKRKLRDNGRHLNMDSILVILRKCLQFANG